MIILATGRQQLEVVCITRRWVRAVSLGICDYTGYWQAATGGGLHHQKVGESSEFRDL